MIDNYRQVSFLHVESLYMYLHVYPYQITRAVHNHDQCLHNNFNPGLLQNDTISFNFNMFTPLTAGAAYIRVFIVY